MQLCALQHIRCQLLHNSQTDSSHDDLLPRGVGVDSYLIPLLPRGEQVVHSFACGCGAMQGVLVVATEIVLVYSAAGA